MMKLRALDTVNQWTTKAGTLPLKYQKVRINLPQRSVILLIKPMLDVVKHNAISLHLI